MRSDDNSQNSDATRVIEFALSFSNYIKGYTSKTKLAEFTKGQDTLDKMPGGEETPGHVIVGK